mmetsp:Transcript_2511/g.3668  ORF Transcript_2511/g.3668 Transcript_2511/m.3668 type:complete len:182 (-) Transcript_2511:110-655(-)
MCLCYFFTLLSLRTMYANKCLRIVGDSISVQVSNNDLLRERYANLSRTPRSRVKLSLRFQHNEIDRITEICEEIKDEITASCPKIVKDGSRPLRVHWADVEDDHISVVVNTSYEIRPSSGAYWTNREVVLLAVARAMKRLDVKFALPERILSKPGTVYKVEGGQEAEMDVEDDDDIYALPP